MTHSSLWSQLRVAMFSLCQFGESRYLHKIIGDAFKLIFYYPTYKKYVNNCWSIIQPIQDKYGINMLIKIRPWMVREEFERRVREGQSPWTLWAFRSALIKLEYGIFFMYGYRVRLVPRDMILPPRRVTQRKDRFAYTAKETAAMLQAAYQLCASAAVVLELIAYTGLRLHEALNLRALDIQKDTLIVFKGKGGKRREVPIPVEAMDLIEEIIYEKTDMDLLFPGLTQQKVRGCMEKACEIAGIKVHKPHNLRHHYAVKQYKQARDVGMDDKEARLKVSRNLGHNRRSVTYAYVPPMIRPGSRK
ncbi:MAG TPA: site-specific integrase [Desulfotomaculum sp.]|nr:MAG: hypothetical protein JL56_03070 [Desulfotomaculum sp. BICA1-6]HBX22687.1 site-specific integrase [Desulfotomaculum sp.]